ncbi:MAG TPA: hypothetical protein PKW30_08165, partial [Campylobacterales bacterium]|nr:hypothetical protein [Campylobacterales bacterium]
MRLFHHKKLRDKILSIAVISNVALVAMIILGFTYLENFANAFKSFERKELKLYEITSSVKDNIGILHRLVLSGSITGFKGNTELTKQLEEAKARSTAEVEKLTVFANGYGEPKLKEIAEKISARYKGLLQMSQTLDAQQASSRQDMLDTLDGIEAVSKRMFAELDELDGYAKRSLLSTSDKIDEDAAEDKKTIFFIGVMGLTLSTVLSLAYIQQILTTLKNIQNGIKNFSDYLLRKQKTIAPITTKSEDEFAEMANMINENIFA